MPSIILNPFYALREQQKRETGDGAEKVEMFRSQLTYLTWYDVLMRISIPSEIEQFIKDQVEAGRFRSADEMVQVALDYFRSKQEVDAMEIDGSDLSRLIAVGQAQADRGELIDGDQALRARRNRRKVKRTG